MPNRSRAAVPNRCLGQEEQEDYYLPGGFVLYVP
jgi:hypothetical protein